MKKIGVLLSSLSCKKYLYDTLEELALTKQVEFFFLINKKQRTRNGLLDKIKFALQRKGLSRTIELILFKVISILEYAILSSYFKVVKELKEMRDLKKFDISKTIFLEPLFSKSGIFVEYSNEDISNIKHLNLDIIIRGNAPGIFRGNMLSSSKKGIISFHHGDNRWNRGSPPGFWEVYLRLPSTGFVIQILTEKLDGGLVLFRGNVPTKRSFTENMANIFNISNPYLAKVIIDYIKNDSLPPFERKKPFNNKILLIPSLIKSILYVFKTFNLYFKEIIQKRILKQPYKWHVAFAQKSWDEADLKEGTKIKNIPNHFFAGPFIVKKNNRNICYVEDYSYLNKKGCITAIEIMDEKNYEILGPVIKEKYHMSFPFIFEYSKKLYMIPETLEAEAIRLYECTEYPLKWKYKKDLMSLQ